MELHHSTKSELTNLFLDKDLDMPIARSAQQVGAWEQKKKPEKCLKMAQNPTRPVVGSRDGTWDFSPGFHPLPHRTGQEVFPHA